MTKRNTLDVEQRERIIVRPNDVTRRYGEDNPDFGVIAVDDLRISFVCEATRHSPVRPDCYVIHPKLAGCEEGEAEQQILERYGIVLERGKLCVCPAPTASCPALTPANPVTGAAVSSPPLKGYGGVGTYTFSAYGLPAAGLQMAADGSISGTAAQSGMFPYTVTVTDSEGNQGTVSCSVTIAPSPSACCVTITAVQGVAITPVKMVGSGGVGGPYTFTASGLPNGLYMAPDGTISGTPAASGTVTFTVTVKDSAHNPGTLSCPATVAPPLSATPVTINAVQGVAMAAVTMVGSGGVGGQYTFSASLPAGLGISSAGIISGTPTANGTFTSTVTVKDSARNPGTVICTVTVAPPVSANCVSINDAVQGVAITPVTMVGSGGAGGPYTFNATGLPHGLTISTGGAISGTPTVHGTFSYSVVVTDQNQDTVTVHCSVTVFSVLATQIQQARKALDAHIASFAALPADASHRAMIAAVSPVIEAGLKFRSELERHGASADPHEQEHGFLLSFPVDFPLPPGDTASVLVFKPGEVEPVKKLNPDPKTGEVFFPAHAGAVFDFEAFLNAFPIQRITLTAS